jgi:hypothetical protein
MNINLKRIKFTISDNKIFIKLLILETIITFENEY